MKTNFMYRFVSIICLFIFYQSLAAQCINGNCENGVGTYLYPDKSRVEGTWRNGMPYGKCKVFYKSGSVYEGYMVDGQKSGFGKFISSNGNIYEGNYKADLQNGAGKFTTTSGYTEEGKYVNDTLTGYATIKYSKGDKYVGYTINGLAEGTGIYYFAGGDKFEGTYKNGKRNGNGTLYYAKGGTLKGTWLNGEYVSGSNKINTEKSNKIITPILSEQNVYEVNVLINKVLKLDMIFDTGASEVYFTPDIVLTLFKTKTITEDDLLEGAYFADANGNVNKSIRFNLRSMQIGDFVIENIPCAVSNRVDGANLFGLSAIKKLGSFEFDFTNTVIKVK
jgi:hypothetical protein